jgi:cation transport regulator
MPYSKNSQLPSKIKNVLPSGAQDIFRKVFNDAYRKYGNDEIASRVAWAAVKKSYKKGRTTSWIKRKDY